MLSPAPVGLTESNALQATTDKLIITCAAFGHVDAPILLPFHTQVWTVPHVSTVWLCAARLHWATVSEIWQRATQRHGPVQPSDVKAMLVSADSGLVTRRASPCTAGPCTTPVNL